MNLVEMIRDVTKMDVPSVVCLISIHPEFVEKIYNSEKKFEFRKQKTRDGVRLFVVYETAPVKMITGCFYSDSCISMHPEMLWNKCADCSGIDEDRFFKYFYGKEIGHAFVIGRHFKFSKYYCLDDFQCGLRAPQSFSYINISR
ncbi:hypothetical protein N1030_07090 [Desulfovibrio mangrovi]|uniref:hypothetical protein n=1 Tax=Desulfovibrio mangrovi TaxID=2976983 RepID=UPI002247F9D6|nr:hypothetical protein [Desulfovibrio mangrovi]UZP68728.1 hypothetical protein N1030_07090 [Desulfovibrio mangrovi]